MKKQMVRFISHEVRTPLNTTYLCLKYLENLFNKNSMTLTLTPRVIDEIKEIIIDSNRSCDDAIDVLNQLLLYDKLESNLLELDKSIIDILPFLESTFLPFERQVSYILYIIHYITKIIHIAKYIYCLSTVILY